MLQTWKILCVREILLTPLFCVLLCALELCYIGEYIIQHQPSHSSIKRLIKFENIRFIFQASLLWLYFIQIWNSVKSNSILDIFIRFNFLHIKQFFVRKQFSSCGWWLLWHCERQGEDWRGVAGAGWHPYSWLGGQISPYHHTILTLHWFLHFLNFMQGLCRLHDFMSFLHKWKHETITQQ